MENQKAYGSEISIKLEILTENLCTIYKCLQFQGKIIILWFLQRPEMHNLQQTKYFEDMMRKQVLTVSKKYKVKGINHIVDK